MNTLQLQGRSRHDRSIVIRLSCASFRRTIGLWICVSLCVVTTPSLGDEPKPASNISQGAGIQEPSQLPQPQQPPVPPSTGAAAVTPDSPQRQLLSVSDIKKNWLIFSVEKTGRDDVWKVQKAATEEDSELICLGKPFGYLQSPEKFADFDMGFEWKYPDDPNGNSGLLVYTDKEERIWPDSIQIQLHAPTAGSIFPAGAATSNTTINVKGLSRPAGEWNSLQVSSRSGRLAVVVNGTRVGEVLATDQTSGRLALQSEGAVVHFRRFWLNPAPKENSVTLEKSVTVETDKPPTKVDSDPVGSSEPKPPSANPQS